MTTLERMRRFRKAWQDFWRSVGDELGLTGLCEHLAELLRPVRRERRVIEFTIAEAWAGALLILGLVVALVVVEYRTIVAHEERDAARADLMDAMVDNERLDSRLSMCREIVHDLRTGKVH